jgi:RNA polymerase sigma-70 factor, ECF subfamily
MDLSDEELMAMYCAGLQEAFDVLYERYRHRIYLYGCSCLRHAADAEDLVQEVFLRVAKSACSYTSQGRFKAWLFQIATNHIRTMFQKKRSESSFFEEMTREFTINTMENQHPERALCAKDSLRSILMNLSPLQRLIFILKEMEGMDSSSIAELLQLTPENVRIQLHRARLHLTQTDKGKNEDRF